MDRHHNRETAVICVYQYLIYPRDSRQLIAENKAEKRMQEDPYMTRVLETAIANRERYAGYIDDVLTNDWTYDRLGLMEQAILLCGCAEFDLKTVEMPVIINEYVELAKKYGDNSYKMINGVLDRI